MKMLFPHSVHILIFIDAYAFDASVVLDIHFLGK